MEKNYFNTRKSIRKYQQKEIPMELIEAMLRDAMHAPTTGNMQLYSAIITTRLEIKQKLAPCHFNQPQITDAPVVITFCADFNRFNQWCHASNAMPGYDNFQSFVMAVLDTTIFAQQFNTIAEMNGLGCCYIGTTTYNAPDIAKVLELPKDVIPILTLTVGYPDESPEQVERLPIDAIIHSEIYHDYTPEKIHRLYEEKESLPVNKQYVEENDKQTLAQVFTDVRYTKHDNELFSDIFFRFIAEQGFHFPDKLF